MFLEDNNLKFEFFVVVILFVESKLCYLEFCLFKDILDFLF